MDASRKAYLDSLPKKRMAAGCLLFNAQRQILLVKPTYKPGWEIPFIFNGGILSSKDIETIRVREAEISEFRFFNAESLPPEMTTTLRRRVFAAYERVSTSKGIYLENQEPA